MPYVLAIEPDPRQAVILRRLVREQVRADFVLAGSRDVALAAIDARVPDLLLVTTLLGPRDEAEITEHLKTLDGASHLQTLTIPLLAVPAPKENLRGRVLGAFMRRKTSSIEGCDPSVFGDEIATYLQRALELKAEQSQREVDMRETQGVAQAPPATVAEQDVPSVAEQEPLAVSGQHIAVAELEPFAVSEQHIAIAEQDFSPVHGEAAPELVVPLRAETGSASSAPAPSPWDELFRALERQFDRNDEKWTDLTPLLASLDEDTGESEQAGLASGSATESEQAGLMSCSATEASGSATETEQAGLMSASTTEEACSATKKPPRRRRRGRWRTLADPLTPIPGVDSLWVANAIASLRLDIERLRLESMPPVLVKERGVRGTGVSPVDKPVSPANVRSLSAPDASSPSNGHHHHPDAGEPKPGRPPQDEWGLYDPEQCGIAALMARLGGQHGEEPEPRPMIPTHAADDADTMAGKPTVQARGGHDDLPGRHLAPLSMWVRMDSSGDVEADRRMALPEPLAHLPALMASLRLPEHVAAVRYGSGCRIRRVRVARRPRRPAGGKRQVIILSRKALREISGVSSFPT